MTDSALFTTTLHTAVQFLLHTVTVSAESVSGLTPGARVTWSTTAAPECVKSVRVDFRTSRHGPVVANYTTTNTSETEIIQNGLQCGTYYYINLLLHTPTCTLCEVCIFLCEYYIYAGNSPVSIRDFSEGKHHFKIVPLGCGRRYTALPFTFTI